MLVLPLLSLAVSALAAPVAELIARQNATAPAECTINWNGTSLTGVKQGESCRYTVRYGTAERWAHPVAATSQDGQNAADFPPKCPQTLDPRQEVTPQSEDCLFFVIYTPANISTAADAPKLPVFFWMHGGAYVGGSASEAGQDGTDIAPNGNLILVTIQYRLGVLGFLPPSIAPTNDDPNFGTRDAILALQSVHNNIGAIGGDPAKVTIGGQSAGASLARTLLGAPAAKGLYRGVILQSDPNNYGSQLPPQRDGLQKLFFGNETISNCTDFACFQKVPVQTILEIQDIVNSKGPSNVTGVPLGEVFRPQASTETLPNDPANLLMNNPAGLSVDIANTPILATTVRNETGYIINGIFPNATEGNPALYQIALTTLFNAERAKIVIDSGLYNSINGSDGLRTSIEHVGTDAAFRCVNRELARRYAGAGGKIWVGEFEKGVSYTFNREGYCKLDGVACHSDDLYLSFGTADDNSTIAIQTLEDQVRQSWVSFITTGTPAPEGVNWPQWTANSSDSEVHPLGEGDVSICPVDFWGTKVKWDFQLWSNTTNSTTPGNATTSGNGQDGNSTDKPAGGAATLGGSMALVALSIGVALLL